jgi:hypothetical protein
MEHYELARCTYRKCWLFGSGWRNSYKGKPANTGLDENPYLAKGFIKRLLMPLISVHSYANRFDGYNHLHYQVCIKPESRHG